MRGGFFLIYAVIFASISMANSQYQRPTPGDIAVFSTSVASLVHQLTDKRLGLVHIVPDYNRVKKICDKWTWAKQHHIWIATEYADRASQRCAKILNWKSPPGNASRLFILLSASLIQMSIVSIHDDGYNWRDLYDLISHIIGEPFNSYAEAVRGTYQLLDYNVLIHETDWPKLRSGKIIL